MIATWMIYSSIIGVALFAGALAADVICRALGIPTRIGWTVALVATLGLSARGIISASRPQLVNAQEASTPSMTVVSTSIIPVGANQGGARADRAGGTSVAPSRVSVDRLRALIPAVATQAATLDRPLAAIVVVLALLALARIAWSLIRLERLARTLPSEDHDGRRVLISEDVGPALLGVFRPRVVVPRWWLALAAADRHVILAHEEQHAASGDQILLIAGALIVALQPWNLGLWLAFARLRLAIEMDCDARVLRTGPAARRYGALLLAVHERAPAPRRRELAFFAGPSNLRQRILRMTRPAPDLRSVAGVASVVALGAAITVAFSTPLPAAPTPELKAASNTTQRDIFVAPVTRIALTPSLHGFTTPKDRDTIFIHSAKRVRRSTVDMSVASSTRPDSIEWEMIPRGFPLPPGSHRIPLHKMFAMGPGARFYVVLGRLQQQRFFELSPAQLIDVCGDVGNTVERWSIRVHEDGAWREWIVPEGCAPSDPALFDRLEGLRAIGVDLFSGRIPRE